MIRFLNDDGAIITEIRTPILYKVFQCWQKLAEAAFGYTYKLGVEDVESGYKKMASGSSANIRLLEGDNFIITEIRTPILYKVFQCWQKLVEAAFGCKAKIILKSSDGVSWKLEQGFARQSQTIRNMMEADSSKTEIPVPNVTGEILAKVVKYWRKLLEVEDSGKAVEEVRESLNQDLLANPNAHFELTAAAQYLHIEFLLELACRTIANNVKGKNRDELRKLLNISVTPEEDAELSRMKMESPFLLVQRRQRPTYAGKGMIVHV